MMDPNVQKWGTKTKKTPLMAAEVTRPNVLSFQSCA